MNEPPSENEKDRRESFKLLPPPPITIISEAFLFIKVETSQFALFTCDEKSTESW